MDPVFGIDEVESMADNIGEAGSGTNCDGARVTLDCISALASSGFADVRLNEARTSPE